MLSSTPGGPGLEARENLMRRSLILTIAALLAGLLAAVVPASSASATTLVTLDATSCGYNGTSGVFMDGTWDPATSTCIPHTDMAHPLAFVNGGTTLTIPAG